MDMNFPRALCQACPADVFWANTTKGSRMLIDREPTITGNIIIGDVGGQILPLARVINRAALTDPTVLLHVPHFATCPGSGRFRKRGRT